MKSRLLQAARSAPVVVLACSLLTAYAADASPADSDPAPPPGAVMVREVQAGGAQIYACRATTGGAFAWTLVGPKAILINDDGSDFGSHAAGPTWSSLDGSSITADGAHPLVKIERPQSVPALLLSVTSSRGEGALSGVRFVRRAETNGGSAPSSGCDDAHVNAMTASHYSAVYTFYR